MVTPKGSMSPEEETQKNFEIFSTYWYTPFCCVCLGCCAAKFGSSGGTYKLPCTCTCKLWDSYTQWHKKNTFFSNNCNFLYFQYKKNYVNTKTTCNKCSFDYLHSLLNYGKLYRKDGVLLAVHTSGASPQSSESHLLTFLVAQLQFLCEWELSDHRLYEVFEHRLLIWGNPKERNRRQISKTCVLLVPPCITCTDNIKDL